MDPLLTSQQAEKKDGALKRPLKLLKMLWPALLAFSPMASAHSRISSSRRLMPSVQSQWQKPVASKANTSDKKQVFSAFSTVKTKQQSVSSAALDDQSVAMDFLQQQGWLTPGKAQAAALSGNQSLLRKEFAAEPDWDDIAAQLSNPSPENYKYATVSCPGIAGAYFQFINNIGFGSSWSEFFCGARGAGGHAISPHFYGLGNALRGVLTANDIPQECKDLAVSACGAGPANAAPTVDANGSGGGTSNTTTFTENGPAVRITTNDASLSDDDNITGMTLVLAATPDGTSEIIAYSAALNGGASLASVSLTGSYNSGSRTYTISGSASAAIYQNVMRAMVYTNSSDAPNTTARTVTITATDAEGATGQATVTINITAVNDAPTATNLTQSKTATEGGGAVALDYIVITDVDTGETVTATFTLSDPSAGTLSTGAFGSAPPLLTPVLACGPLRAVLRMLTPRWPQLPLPLPPTTIRTSPSPRVFAIRPTPGRRTVRSRSQSQQSMTRQVSFPVTSR
ncbi:MAG: hypothetical protein NVV73_19200 [Cellvibrionaceae bacterium]|nr:hypothetical protein [Cellvibrionaceae bacterium]